MPVHLFGRPAPLAELAELGAAADRGRGAGVRLAGHRAHGRRVDLQLLPDEEPLRARRRRARLDRRPGPRRARPHAALPRLEVEADLRVHRDELEARRDPGGGAPHLPAGARLAGRRCAARPPSATASSASARRATCPADEPGHVYHLFVSRSPQRDEIRAALTEAQIGSADYYLPPLHLQPALRFLGYSEGDLPETERAARENFSVPLWAGITAEQQARVVETVRAALGVPA